MSRRWPNTYVAMEPQAKRQLDELGKRLGMTEMTMMKRLIEFYVQQDDWLQSVMIEHYPQQVKRELAKLLLEKL